MASSPQKLLVWDFDGTLGRRKPTWGETLLAALNEASASHGLTVHDLNPHLQTGFPWHDAVSTRNAIPSPDEWWAALESVFVRAYVACRVDLDRANAAAGLVRGRFVDLSDWELYADSLPALAAAQRAGWTQVILSNNVPEFPEIIGALGLNGYIDRTFTSAALLAEKPNRVVFQAVSAAYPQASSVVMVGDNPIADIEGARAAGMRAILARAGQSGIDAIVTLDELEARLDQTPK